MVNSGIISGEMQVKTALRDFKGRNYTPYFNSSKNSRGIGALIASEIDF